MLIDMVFYFDCLRYDIFLVLMMVRVPLVFACENNTDNTIQCIVDFFFLSLFIEIRYVKCNLVNFYVVDNNFDF